MNQGPTILAGIRAIEALLRTPERLRRVWCLDESGARQRVVDAARAAGIEVHQASPDRLSKLADGIRHQGVVAEIVPREPAEWAELIAQPDGLILAFDQVTDPHNLGAALRSAEAFGATGALVTRNRSARPGPVVARTSAGASELLPIAIETNLARALRQAQEAGYRVIAADLDGPAPENTDLTGPLVVVIGAEGKGIRRLTREVCDLHLTIPMAGLTESLNASVAAAVMLYEVARQRRCGAGWTSAKK